MAAEASGVPATAAGSRTSDGEALGRPLEPAQTARRSSSRPGRAGDGGDDRSRLAAAVRADPERERASGTTRPEPRRSDSSTARSNRRGGRARPVPTTSQAGTPAPTAASHRTGRHRLDEAVGPSGRQRLDEQDGGSFERLVLLAGEVAGDAAGERAEGAHLASGSRSGPTGASPPMPCPSRAPAGRGRPAA